MHTYMKLFIHILQFVFNPVMPYYGSIPVASHPGSDITQVSSRTCCKERQVSVSLLTYISCLSLSDCDCQAEHFNCVV